MKVELEECTREDHLRLDRLMQLYVHDFTDFLEWDLNEEGRFEEEILAEYFVDEPKFAWLIRADGKLAGFVLVNMETVLKDNAGGHNVREFFVVRRWRRYGVGKAAAIQIFSRFPGKWEVRVMQRNVKAQKFWEATISEYTQGNYRKELRDDNLWRGAIFSFETT